MFFNGFSGEQTTPATEPATFSEREVGEGDDGQERDAGEPWPAARHRDRSGQRRQGAGARHRPIARKRRFLCTPTDRLLGVTGEPTVPNPFSAADIQQMPGYAEISTSENYAHVSIRTLKPFPSAHPPRRLDDPAQRARGPRRR